MGSTTSSPSSNVNTSQEGTQIGEIKTPQLMILATVVPATPATPAVPAAPQSNPCNTTDLTLTA